MREPAQEQEGGGCVQHGGVLIGRSRFSAGKSVGLAELITTSGNVKIRVIKGCEAEVISEKWPK